MVTVVCLFADLMTCISGTEILKNPGLMHFLGVNAVCYCQTTEQYFLQEIATARHQGILNCENLLDVISVMKYV